MWGKGNARALPLYFASQAAYVVAAIVGKYPAYGILTNGNGIHRLMP
ncbi:MAG: hypothetical protein KatS3mg055_0506 [Chloroflexus sp.]|nr:MAG: hypothetical protein KatS3mg055_0506 [Chloroflexus sp.]